MRYLIYIFILTLIISAETIGLNELLGGVEQLQLLDSSRYEESLALEAEVKANSSNEPYIINQSFSKIGKRFDSSEYGITTSISREMKLESVKKLEIEAETLTNRAYLIERELQTLELRNEIALMYHQYCIGEEYLQSFQGYFANLEELYRKKQIAYRSEDIAKTELLQVELERNRQQNILNSLMREQKDSREQLLIVGNFSITDNLSCSDLYPIKESIDFGSNLFPITEESYNSKKMALQTAVERYGKRLESINLSAEYSYEEATNFYTVGVEIPLEFTSKRNEYRKVATMHKISALEMEHKRSTQRRLYRLKRLEVELKTIVHTVLGLRENIEEFKSKLLPLLKRSYDYGESSVMEYLLTQQRLNVLERELLEYRKSYYNKLFSIYMILEKKEI